MKVFQCVNNPYKLGNPYISTLMDGISEICNDIEWGYGLDNFWKDIIFEYDIIHIHWPGMLLASGVEGNKLLKIKKRFLTLKESGIKIYTTCHNLEPHYTSNQDEKDVYSLVYGMADTMIHLGEYSKLIMSERYPKARHEIIPHHIYDRLYKKTTKTESTKKLGLNPNKKYILCFGAFRDDEERNIANQVLESFRKKGVEVLAPNYYKIVKRRNLLLMIYQWLKCKWKTISMPGLHIRGWYVSDELLPYYYGASDISLIQRKKILNSGNLPMGLMMGNVVVGPDTGNVGGILKQLDNPVFDPTDDSSIISALENAFHLVENGKGEENTRYADEHLSTHVISAQLLQLYRSCI